MKNSNLKDIAFTKTREGKATIAISKKATIQELSEVVKHLNTFIEKVQTEWYEKEDIPELLNYCENLGFDISVSDIAITLSSEISHDVTVSPMLGKSIKHGFIEFTADIPDDEDEDYYYLMPVYTNSIDIDYNLWDVIIDTIFQTILNYFKNED